MSGSKGGWWDIYLITHHVSTGLYKHGASTPENVGKVPLLSGVRYSRASGIHLTSISNMNIQLALKDIQFKEMALNIHPNQKVPGIHATVSNLACYINLFKKNNTNPPGYQHPHTQRCTSASLTGTWSCWSGTCWPKMGLPSTCSSTSSWTPWTRPARQRSAQSQQWTKVPQLDRIHDRFPRTPVPNNRPTIQSKNTSQ